MPLSHTMLSFLRYSCFWLVFIGSLGQLTAQVAVPARPNPPRLVNDFANLLSPQEQTTLERKLVAYDDSTSTQIALVIIPSLDGANAFDFSQQLATEWGIGQDDKDNGILLFISLQDRKIGFQTGYGAESFLTDALSKRIIDQVIRPAFRSNRFYEGLDQATDIVMQLGSGQYEPTQKKQSARGGRTMFIVLVGLFLFLLIISATQDRKGRDDDDDDEGGYWRGGRYDKRYKRRQSGWGGGWIFLPGNSGWGSRGGGGGWFGDSDGGGFGGFGGGDFGGGGAWGDW